MLRFIEMRHAGSLVTPFLEPLLRGEVSGPQPQIAPKKLLSSACGMLNVVPRKTDRTML